MDEFLFMDRRVIFTQQQKNLIGADPYKRIFLSGKAGCGKTAAAV